MKTPFKALSKAILVIFLAGLASISFAKTPRVVEPKLLGVIDFGKTTIPAFTHELQKKGCTVHGNAIEAKAEEACFLLPGHPTVVVDSEEGAPIDMVTLTYKKGIDAKEYDAYLDKLCETYGKPARQENNVQTGFKYAVWIHNGMVVELEEPIFSFEGYVTYMTPEDYGQVKMLQKQAQIP